MLLKILLIVTILLVALLAGLAFAHVLEQPAKMQYDAVLYLTLQKSLYVQWGPPHIGGMLEPLAIAATGLLAFFRRKHKHPLWFSLGRCSHCYWRFRSSSSGWSLRPMPPFSLPRCRTFRSIGWTCVQTGKWDMPFVSRFSSRHSHCLFYHWRSKRKHLPA